MREIIFRGMTKDKKWLFGDVSHRGGKVFIFPKDGLDSYDNYEVTPETVGQYTGLKDKNGKEIYEGDKCKNEYEQIGQIEFCDGMFYFVELYPNGGVHVDMFTPYPITNAYLEIIGNIHDKEV